MTINQKFPIGFLDGLEWSWIVSDTSDKSNLRASITFPWGTRHFIRIWLKNQFGADWCSKVRVTLVGCIWVNQLDMLKLLRLIRLSFRVLNLKLHDILWRLRLYGVKVPLNCPRAPELLKPNEDLKPPETILWMQNLG